MVVKVIKIIVNSILILLCLSSALGGVAEFNQAHNWLELLRGAFWFVLGFFAMFILIDKIKENKWPLQQ